MTARGITGILAVVCLLVIGGAALAVLPVLASAATDAEQVGRQDAVLEQVGELRDALATWQNFFEQLANAAPQVGQPDTVSSLSEATILAQSALDVGARTIGTLATLEPNVRSEELATALATFEDVLAKLPAVALDPSSRDAAALFVAERAAYERLWDVTGTATTQLTGIRDLHQERVTSHLEAARVRAFAILALAGVMIVVVAVVFGERARRRALAEHTKMRRQQFEVSLQRGLELAQTESAVYGIVQRALYDSVAHLQVELLVADSSRAHFHQSLHTAAGDSEERSGCGVVTPADCPAAKRNDTLVFPTSTALDACPYLQDRPSGPCSAVCVSVSIGGMAGGVLHATGVDHHPPNDTEIGYLEVTTRRTAERITMLRAFERSETQAHTDPLTGLLNRRSLENQVRDLQLEGIAYAVAYGDLDHFKVLNDTHGHEAGDQALRLFSRVVRDSIRPNDIAARYGGEEFVIILPDCDTSTATIVLERVREHLALALATGQVPAFTVSFGLVSSTAAATFDQTVAQADHALLAAKNAGRNRVIVATSPTEPIQPKIPG